MTSPLPIEQIRQRFPALQREVSGQPAVFLDGPAGSQVPDTVIHAVGDYLAHHNANLGGHFVSSKESDEVMAGARAAAADLLGSAAREEIVFGPNMTALTVMLSDHLSRTWKAGDEVVVTRADHDANVTPWVLAAEQAGATVHHVDIVKDDCTLDLEDFESKLSDRTRLVAIGAASNLVGTIHPIAEISRRARDAGALVFVDAVHYAPHRAIDVAAWDCDFVACSAYKFYGPHVGILWGRGEILRSLRARKLRPVSDEIPDRWMYGTPNIEGVAGTRAAIDYIAELGHELTGPSLSRRDAIRAAFSAIETHENELCDALIAGLTQLSGVKVWGITDTARGSERTPTVAFTSERHRPEAIAAHLAERGIFAWNGNNYALALSEALGLEPDGAVRVGLLHYNTAAEVARLIDTLGAM